MEALIRRFLEDAPTKGMAIIEDSYKRLLKRKVTYLLLLVLLSPVILAWPMHTFLENETEINEDGERVIIEENDDGTEEETKIGNQLAQFFVLIFNLAHLRFLILITVLSLGVGLINDEREDRTMPLLATSPITRFEILFYKYISGIAIMTGLIWIPVVILYLAFVGLAGTGAIGENLGLLGVTLLISFLAVSGYTSIFFTLAVTFKRPMIWGAIYIFLWELFLGLMPNSLQKVTVLHYVNSTAYPLLANFTEDKTAAILLLLVDYNVDIIATGWVSSLLVLALVSVMFLILAGLSFSSRDID